MTPIAVVLSKLILKIYRAFPLPGFVFNIAELPKLKD